MDKLNQLKYITDQLIGHGNIKVIDSDFSVNYTAHSGDKTYKGRKFIKAYTKQIRTAIPNVVVLKVELLSQADNVLTWQRTFSGTHKIKLKGIPASNKKIKWHEIIVSRFEEDKIIEEWVVSDLAFQLMLKQNKL